MFPFLEWLQHASTGIKKIDQQQFLYFCRRHLDVKDAISNQSFMDDEAYRIWQILTGSESTNKLPVELIKVETIRSIVPELFIGRLLSSQHENHHTCIEEFFTAFKVLKAVEAILPSVEEVISSHLYKMDTLLLFRSAFALFAMAGTAGGRKGFISFSGGNYDATLTERFGISKDTCRLAATRLSIDGSSLRTWLLETVFNEKAPYQKYYPLPLYSHPLIHLDEINPPNTYYCMPSPKHFIRGFCESLFTNLRENCAPEFGSILGEKFEEHIGEALSKIFGADIVERLSGSGTHADFLLRLNAFTLIIEIKLGLASKIGRSIMSPHHIALLWERLYGSVKQCAASMHKVTGDAKPVLGLVLVGDNIVGEILSFQSFALKSGLYQEMRITGVEFLSWNSLEATLAETSVQKFEAAFSNKWISGSPSKLADIMTFDLERDFPAHHYEYLDDVEKHIFDGIGEN